MLVSFRVRPGLDEDERVAQGVVRNDSAEAMEGKVHVQWEHDRNISVRLVSTEPRMIPPGGEADFQERIQAKGSRDWRARVEHGPEVRDEAGLGSSTGQGARVHVETNEVTSADVTLCLEFRWSQAGQSADGVGLQVSVQNVCDRRLPAALTSFRVDAMDASGSPVGFGRGRLYEALEPGAQRSVPIAFRCDASRVATYSVVAGN
jgi:hypothetical protein